MIKRDEIEHTESCFNKARDNERLFVLLARDPAAPVAIRAWVAERLRLGKNKPEDAQIREAIECANRMDVERVEIESARGQQQMSWAAGGGSHALTISRFVSRLAPSRHEFITWQQLATLFADPRRTECTVATCHGSACPYKDGECWSPAVFRFNRRRPQEVDAISCLVLDIDHASEAVIEELRAQLVDYQHLIHTTHADRPDNRCMRIVVQLSYPVIAAEWPRFRQAAIAALGAPADLECGDVARCWFLPSRPRDADYFAVVHAGKPLDVDSLLSAVPVPHSPAVQAVVQEGAAQ